MRDKFVLFFLICVLIGYGAAPRANAQDTQKTKIVRFCAVVFGFQVSPRQELEVFDLQGPALCANSTMVVEVSDAWKKTACGYFSAKRKAPTYKKGEKPRMLYSFYFINPERPNVLYPTQTAGSSPEDPVVYVQESILNETSDQTNACDRMIENGR